MLRYLKEKTTQKTKDLHPERVGELFILAQAVIGAMSPVLIRGSNNFLPPLFFTGISSLIAGIIFLAYVAFKRNLKQLVNRKALPYMLGAGLLLMCVAFPIRFFAGQHIPAGNLALLWQMEAVFSFIYFGFLGIEPVNPRRVLGACLILAGDLLIVYHNFSADFGKWDFMIIGATMLTPWAVYFHKLGFKYVSASAFLCFRSLMGALVVLPASLVLENIPWANVFSAKGLLFIGFNGILIYAVSKMLAFQGVKAVDVSKYLAMGGSRIALALLFAFLMLGEVPILIQFLGFAIILLGLSQLMIKNKAVVQDQEVKLVE